MSLTNQQTLQAFLDEMREIHQALDELNSGICLLHLDAAIAALESHILRAAAANDETSGQQASVVRP